MGYPAMESEVTQDGRQTLVVQGAEYILRDGSMASPGVTPYEMPLFFANTLAPGRIAGHAKKVSVNEKRGQPETEEVTTNGVAVPCVVVKVHDPSSLFPKDPETTWTELTLWLDSAGHRILRYEALGEHLVDSPFGGTTLATMRHRYEFTTFEMTGEGEPAESNEGRFRILVPQGARRVDRFSPPPGVPAPPASRSYGTSARSRPGAMSGSSRSRRKRRMRPPHSSPPQVRRSPSFMTWMDS